MDCPICLNPVIDDDEDKVEKKIYTAPCGHMFHENCYKRYETYNKNLELTCPICKQILKRNNMELEVKPMFHNSTAPNREPAFSEQSCNAYHCE